MSEGRDMTTGVVVDGWHGTIEPPRTTCKHRDGRCERCGTSDRRDALHTTRNGRGVVADKLRKR